MDGTTFCYKLTFQKVGALKGGCLGIEVDFTGYPIQPYHKDKFDLNWCRNLSSLIVFQYMVVDGTWFCYKPIFPNNSMKILEIMMFFPKNPLI